jgi:hypothetical protein
MTPIFLAASRIPERAIGKETGKPNAFSHLLLQ